MRHLPYAVTAAALIAVASLHLSAFAQAPAAPVTATIAPPVAGVPDTNAPPSPAQRARPRRQSLADRFAEVNTTHDGHLTRDQASVARWYYVTNNFEGIDKDRHGFITVDDIRAYAAAKRAARKAVADAAAVKG
jgi:hypothetical protein